MVSGRTARSSVGAEWCGTSKLRERGVEELIEKEEDYGKKKEKSLF
jgi:hypothetical protein